MKETYNKKLKCTMLEPETPLEAVEHLLEFFEVDMWHSKGAEWKTEKDMQKYLKTHFGICMKSIKGVGK